jgi:hypothetical protein
MSLVNVETVDHLNIICLNVPIPMMRPRSGPIGRNGTRSLRVNLEEQAVEVQEEVEGSLVVTDQAGVEVVGSTALQEVMAVVVAEDCNLLQLPWHLQQRQPTLRNLISL